MRIRLWHKIVSVAALPLVFGVVYFVCLGALLHDTYQASEREASARRAFDAADLLLHKTFNVATAVWQYSLTLQEKDLQYFRETRAEMLRLAEEASPAGDTGPSLKAALQKGKQRLLHALEYADDAVELLPKKSDPLVYMTIASKFREMLPAVAETKAAWSDIRKEIEKTVKTSESDLSGRVQLLRALILVGMVLSAAVSLFAAFGLQKSVVERLSKLSALTDRLLKREQTTPVVGATDEIGDLERAYQSMSAQILEAMRHERAVVDNAADVIFTLDEEGRFVSVSPAAKSVWHYAPDVLVGQSIVDTLIPASHRDAFTENLRAARESERPFIFETAVVAESGACQSTRFSAHCPPNSALLFCVAHDVSEMVRREEQLRANEERFRIITQSMPGSLFLLDKNMHILRSNEQATLVTGLSNEDLLGRNFAALLQPADFSLLSSKSNQVQLFRQDGSARWVEMTVDEFHHDGQEGCLAVLMDVTERVEFERMRDNLTAMLVHDIGTPLSTMQGVFKLLTVGKYGALTDTGKTQAALGDYESTQLIRLFKDFVSLQRHGTVQLDISGEPVQLDTVLQQSVDAMRPLADQYDVRFSLSKTDALVKADLHKIAQVVINLLTHLIRKLPPPTTISLMTTRCDEDVEVVIKDDSTAAASEEIDDALDWSELGLAIAKAVVEAHGGTIGARKGKAGGTELWLRLPV